MAPRPVRHGDVPVLDAVATWDEDAGEATVLVDGRLRVELPPVSWSVLRRGPAA